MEHEPPGARTQELAQQADLLKVFADREITIFGMTDNFQNLAKMCPLDLEGEAVSLEAKNAFVVKAANEVGMEIEPAYHSMFTEIAQQQGLEIKFTIGREEKPLADSLFERAEAEAITMLSRLEDPDIFVKVATAKESVLDETIAIIRARNMSDELLVAPQQQQAQTEATPSVIKTLKTTSPQRTPKLTASVTETGFTLPRIVPTEQIDVVREVRVAVDERRYLPVEQDAAITRTDMSSVAELLFDTETATPELVSPKPDWITELTKEPEAQYQTFMEALYAFQEPDQELPPELESVTLRPTINQLIAKRMEELEPDQKEIAAGVVQDIIATVHGIAMLEVHQIESEEITLLKAQLEEQCIALFQSLHIDVKPEMIQQFIAMLTNAEFKPAEDTATTIDLEYAGTREAKYRLSKFLGKTISVQHLQQVLGTLVLLHINTKLPLYKTA